MANTFCQQCIPLVFQNGVFICFIEVDVFWRVIVRHVIVAGLVREGRGEEEKSHKLFCY